MQRLLLAALISGTALFTAGTAQAQYTNPYASPYRQWNQSFPGYQGGSREYRRQIRDMNPYGGSYRQIEQNNRRYSSWSNW